MSAPERDEEVAEPRASTRRGARSLASRALILGLLGRMRNGAIIVREGGRRHLCGRPVPGETVPEIVVRSPEAWRAVASEGSSGLGRAYVEGWWTCSSLDELATFLRVVVRNLDAFERASAIGRRFRGRVQRGDARRQGHSGGTGVGRAAGAVDELGSEFFSLFLGPTMSYSSGIFSGPESSLEDAQVAKFDRLCRKLALGPEDHVLEIGTGWGSFAVHAARRHGCRVTTATGSTPHFEYASARVASEGLSDLVTVVHEDYGSLAGTYDRVVSIETIESLDWRQHDRFVRACSSLLEPDGLMALQTIVVDDRSFDRAKRSDDFAKRFVLPGSTMPSIATIVDSVARVTDLRLVALDDIGNHYAETLRRWRSRLGAQGAALDEAGVDAATRRVFEFYFAYREAGLAERRTGDVQCVFAKPGWLAAGLAPPVS